MDNAKGRGRRSEKLKPIHYQLIVNREEVYPVWGETSISTFRSLLTAFKSSCNPR